MQEGYIAVDTNILRRDEEIFREQMSLLKQEAETLMREAESLPSMWEGPASQAFADQMKQDYNRIVELCSGLTDYLECMEDAEKYYIQCENDVADIIDALRI